MQESSENKPTKEDIVKLHEEINQTINQRLTIITAAIGTFGIVIGFIISSGLYSTDSQSFNIKDDILEYIINTVLYSTDPQSSNIKDDILEYIINAVLYSTDQNSSKVFYSQPIVQLLLSISLFIFLDIMYLYCQEILKQLSVMAAYLVATDSSNWEKHCENYFWEYSDIHLKKNSLRATAYTKGYRSPLEMPSYVFNTLGILTFLIPLALICFFPPEKKNYFDDYRVKLVIIVFIISAFITYSIFYNLWKERDYSDYRKEAIQKWEDILQVRGEDAVQSNENEGSRTNREQEKKDLTEVKNHINNKENRNKILEGYLTNFIFKILISSIFFVVSFRSNLSHNFQIIYLVLIASKIVLSLAPLYFYDTYDTIYLRKCRKKEPSAIKQSRELIGSVIFGGLLVAGLACLLHNLIDSSPQALIQLDTFFNWGIWIGFALHKPVNELWNLFLGPIAQLGQSQIQLQKLYYLYRKNEIDPRQYVQLAKKIIEKDRYS